MASHLHAEHTPTALRPWLLIATAAGLLVWVQILVGVLIDPELAGVSRLAGVAAGLAGGVVLAVGLWRRSAAALLFFVPALLLTPVLAMSEASRTSLFSPIRWSIWLLGFAVYLVAACLRCGERVSQVDFESRPVAPVEPALSSLDAFRGVIGLAALVGPVLIYVQATAGEHFSAQVHAEVVFHHLLLLFAWVIAFYAFFLAPLINRSADRIEWERKRYLLMKGRGRLRLHASRLLSVALLIVLAIIVFNSSAGT